MRQRDGRGEVLFFLREVVSCISEQTMRHVFAFEAAGLLSKKKRRID